MPLYDYQCPGCAHQFEVKQSFSADPFARCPRCQTASRRVFHPVPVIYKGTGFYTTDYARKGVNFHANGHKEVGEKSAAAKTPAAAVAS
jgi:putative FmdB family regulatory protein